MDIMDNFNNLEHLEKDIDYTSKKEILLDSEFFKLSEKYLINNNINSYNILNTDINLFDYTETSLKYISKKDNEKINIKKKKVF